MRVQTDFARVGQFDVQQLEAMEAPSSPPTKFIPPSSSEGSDDEGMSDPAPIRIIEAIERDHTFVLNEKGLARILLNPKIADKKVMDLCFVVEFLPFESLLFQVAIVSVAGAFRKGKSFLLNFFLRYLNNSVCLILTCVIAIDSMLFFTITIAPIIELFLCFLI